MSQIRMEQISAMNISFQFYSLEYFLESVARIGFQSVDLWTGYPHMLLDQDYAAQCREIRQRCDDLGLAVSNVTPKVIGWPLNIADESPKIRERAMDYLKRAVDASEILGAPSLQLTPGTGLYDRPREAAWERARESLRRLADFAGGAGKYLALEAIQIVESNLVNNREDLVRMLEEVDSPVLGAVVDTTHMAKNGESLDEYLETLGDRVRRIHLNETDQLPWGEGKAPLQVYLNHLNQAGYQGPITVEICSKPHYLKPYAAMKNSYDYLKDALARQ